MLILATCMKNGPAVYGLDAAGMRSPPGRGTTFAVPTPSLPMHLRVQWEKLRGYEKFRLSAQLPHRFSRFRLSLYQRPRGRLSVTINARALGGRQGRRKNHQRRGGIILRGEDRPNKGVTSGLQHWAVFSSLRPSLPEPEPSCQ